MSQAEQERRDLEAEGSLHSSRLCPIAAMLGAMVLCVVAVAFMHRRLNGVTSS